jgi:hypothetical protein
MYNDWDKEGNYTDEWMDKTRSFLDCAFFKLLKASEVPLHEHIEVIVLAFVTRLMTIKSMYFFSNNCYNKLMKLVSDILLKPHKVTKDMYQSNKLMSTLGLKYEKIDVYPNNCILF